MDPSSTAGVSQHVVFVATASWRRGILIAKNGDQKVFVI